MSSEGKSIHNRLIFIGGYGSGKTEVAVNFARHLKRNGASTVSVIDLDVVNPYFRSREAADSLSREGISVVAPYDENFFSDQPIVLPAVRSLLQQPVGQVVIDVGGDPVGATVLSSLHDLFPQNSYDLWAVVNGRRPGTSTLPDTIAVIRSMEAASSLQVTGIVSNTHLLGETTLDIILEGVRLARAVAQQMNLPLTFVAAAPPWNREVREEECECPVLPLELTMLRPWER